MMGLDTNVLVRYIMQDDAKQSPKATKLIESMTVDEPGFVPIVSVIERAAASAGCARTMTFDAGAAKVAGMTLIQ